MLKRKIVISFRNGKIKVGSFTELLNAKRFLKKLKLITKNDN